MRRLRERKASRLQESGYKPLMGTAMNSTESDIKSSDKDLNLLGRPLRIVLVGGHTRNVRHLVERDRMAGWRIERHSGVVPTGKMKALSQNGLSIHGSSRLPIKGIMSTVHVWSDDFRDGDYYRTGFQERSQRGGWASASHRSFALVF